MRTADLRLSEWRRNHHPTAAAVRTSPRRHAPHAARAPVAAGLATPLPSPTKPGGEPVFLHRDQRDRDRQLVTFLLE